MRCGLPNLCIANYRKFMRPSEGHGGSIRNLINENIYFYFVANLGCVTNTPVVVASYTVKDIYPWHHRLKICVQRMLLENISLAVNLVHENKCMKDFKWRDSKFLKCWNNNISILHHKHPALTKWLPYIHPSIHLLQLLYIIYACFTSTWSWMV